MLVTSPYKNNTHVPNPDSPSGNYISPKVGGFVVDFVLLLDLYTQLAVFSPFPRGSPLFSQVWKKIQIFPSNVVFGFFKRFQKVGNERNYSQDPWLNGISVYLPT